MFTKHSFSCLLHFFHHVNSEGLPGPGEPDCDPCAWYPCRRYSGITTCLIKKVASTKSWYIPKTEPVFAQQAPSPLGNEILDVVRLCIQLLLPGIFHIQEGHVSGRQGQHKNWLGLHIMKKLHEIGGYLNKGYHIFIDSYFMSVPLVHHLHQRSICVTGTVRSNRKLLPQQFKNKFAVSQIWSSSCKCFPREEITENSVILLSHHATAKEEEVRGRHGGNPQTT
jgi:hypothetical protein